MVIIITTNSIDLKNHIKLKNTRKVQSVGEIDLTISKGISFNEELLNFKVKESKIELLVGLNWVKNNSMIPFVIYRIILGSVILIYFT